MAGLGLAPSAAADDIGSASRGNFRDSDEIADAADRGLPIRGERIGSSYKRIARRDFAADQNSDR
jgi:hypothetical protein